AGGAVPGGAMDEGSTRLARGFACGACAAARGRSTGAEAERKGVGCASPVVLVSGGDRNGVGAGRTGALPSDTLSAGPGAPPLSLPLLLAVGGRSGSLGSV